jgi:hypothetical protein
MNCAPITHRAYSNAVTCGDGVVHSAEHFKANLAYFLYLSWFGHVGRS